MEYIKKMDFKDIPKFKSWGNYEVDVPIDYLLSHLKRYDEIGLELCPDFQRGHVWTTSQQICFVEFILKGGRSARNIFFNCSSWMKKFDTPIQCIDGLQRLTACIKFLNDEIGVFDNIKYSEFNGHVPMDAALRFHINDLKTRKEVLEWYKELNFGGTVHTSDEMIKIQKMIDECL